MRDRWLRDAFAAVPPPLTTESDQISSNDDRRVATMNTIDEDEALRLLIDYGIAEDKAKVRLQVKNNCSFAFILYVNLCLKKTQIFIKEMQTNRAESTRGCFSTEELVNVFKELSTRPEIYHLLVR